MNDMLTATEWVGSGEVLAEPFLMDGTLIDRYNMPQVFYYMYYVNQIGNYFASDDEDGNTTEPIGWLNGFPGFPTQLWDADAGRMGQSPRILTGLAGWLTTMVVTATMTMGICR